MFEDDDVTGNKVVRQFEHRLRKLERLLGRKTLEPEILREVLDKSRSKKSISLSRARAESYPRYLRASLATSVGCVRYRQSVRGPAGRIATGRRTDRNRAGILQRFERFQRFSPFPGESRLQPCAAVRSLRRAAGRF
ncbi:hypothetical protein GN330_02110 [Nitratireductor sp. CAU 1489]|uniref:Uncharacterized protein n=1 Tax=Nitratireductor arenosus TaxID=2682096 RepID=A0A844QA63_9HYPH|nr:hypothetical protein [Nitratireductor arenosus]